jgi:hypothetical protein
MQPIDYNQIAQIYDGVCKGDIASIKTFLR